MFFVVKLAVLGIAFALDTYQSVGQEVGRVYSSIGSIIKNHDLVPEKVVQAHNTGKAAIESLEGEIATLEWNAIIGASAASAYTAQFSAYLNGLRAANDQLLNHAGLTTQDSPLTEALNTVKTQEPALAITVIPSQTGQASRVPEDVVEAIVEKQHKISLEVTGTVNKNASSSGSIGGALGGSTSNTVSHSGSIPRTSATDKNSNLSESSSDGGNSDTATYMAPFRLLALFVTMFM